jgi:uncharacterized protein (DUF433 family)
VAARERRSISDVAERFLDEAIRLRECPGIYFADEPAGRVAKVSGTGLAVWEVMGQFLAVGESKRRLLDIFPQLGKQQLAAARNYYLRHRQEVEAELEENRALSPEVVAARYPGLIHIAEV